MYSKNYPQPNLTGGNDVSTPPSIHETKALFGTAPAPRSMLDLGFATPDPRISGARYEQLQEFLELELCQTGPKFGTHESVSSGFSTALWTYMSVSSDI
ncbi:hypothetical protein ACP70R_010792 [Stipagrostis hirtigluma subsp. patula]